MVYRWARAQFAIDRTGGGPEPMGEGALTKELEMLEAWQRGNVRISEAIQQTAAGDAWALPELALDCGIEILIGDRD